MVCTAGNGFDESGMGRTKKLLPASITVVLIHRLCLFARSPPSFYSIELHLANPENSRPNLSGFQDEISVDGRDDVTQEECVPLATALPLSGHIFSEPDVPPARAKQDGRRNRDQRHVYNWNYTCVPTSG